MQIAGSRYHNNFPNTSQHQRGKRVIDHGLVVDGKQAFAYGVSDGIEACTRASRENDSFVFRGPFSYVLRHGKVKLHFEELAGHSSSWDWGVFRRLRRD